MLHEQCHKAVAVCLLAGWVLPPIIPTVYKHATCCLRAQTETGTVLFYVVSVCIVNPFATCSRSSFNPIAFNELCWAVLMLLLLDLVIHKEVGPHFCQFVGSSYEKVHWFQWSCTGDWSTLREKLCSVGEWNFLKLLRPYQGVTYQDTSRRNRSWCAKILRRQITLQGNIFPLRSRQGRGGSSLKYPAASGGDS